MNNKIKKIQINIFLILILNILYILGQKDKKQNCNLTIHNVPSIDSDENVYELATDMKKPDTR